MHDVIGSMGRNRFPCSCLSRYMTLALAIVVVAVCSGCAGPRAPRPDVVFLIVVDTLRPDRLSCYGYSEITTSNIDMLAREGVRFEQAQSVASWTIPSMGSMLTSLYPTQLGLVEQKAPSGTRFEWQERREQNASSIPLWERTLAEVLQDEGFHTAAFVNQPGLITGEGFMQGFDDWYYPVTPDTIRRREPGERIALPEWPPLLGQAAVADLALVRKFDEWLGEHTQEKLFVWLHLLTPHRPYNPPQGFELVPQDQATSSQKYDGELRFVDALMGHVLASIEKRVGWTRPLIVFTSDHGEALGEHGMFDHGHSLHREVIHVPLIMTAKALPAGRVVDPTVRTIDILPTILDLLDFGSLAPQDIRGSSLLPLIDGGNADLFVYSEAMLYGSTERSVIAGNYKLMYDEQDDQYALYDTHTDRAEKRNVIGVHRPRAVKMQTLLSDLHGNLVGDYRQRRAGVEADSTASQEEARRLLKAMRSLGYLNE